MTTGWDFNREQIGYWFKRFEAALKRYSLPDGRGGYRTAEAGEFMLMHRDKSGEVHFKHRFTRQYVVLCPNLEGDALVARGTNYEPGPTLEELRAKIAMVPKQTPVKLTDRGAVRFSEAECSGSFDGFSVTSDADPGL